MRAAMEIDAERQLDERAAVDVMGWVRGGPDLDFWMLRDPPAGLTSIFRMPVNRWHPTVDPFCLELLLQEVRSRGLAVDLAEDATGEAPGYACTIGGREGADPSVRVSAATPGLAVVCAALAHEGGPP